VRTFERFLCGWRNVSFKMKPFAIVTLRLMTEPEGKP